MALDRAAVHLTKVISSDSDSSARSNGLNSSATAARIRRLSTYPSHIPVPVRPTQAKCRPGMVPENGSGYTMFKHSKTAPSAINTSKDTSERAAARINYKVSDQSLRNRARIVVNRKCVPTKDFNASGSERLPKNPIQKRSSLNLRCFSDTGPRIKDNLGFYSCQGQVSTLAQDPAGRLKSCTPGVHSGRPGQVHAEGSQQQNILKLSYGRGSNSSGNQATPITSRGCTDIGPRPWQHTTRIEAAKAKASAAETSITEEEENQGLVRVHQPQSYWLGRFVAFINNHHKRDILDNPHTLADLLSMNLEKGDTKLNQMRCERNKLAFATLESHCITEESRRSFLAFRRLFIRKYGGLSDVDRKYVGRGGLGLLRSNMSNRKTSTTGGGQSSTSLVDS